MKNRSEPMFTFEVNSEVTGSPPSTASAKCHSAAGHKRAIRVQGPNPYTGDAQVHEYSLFGTDQSTYLDLFEALARDFGTRVPRNRQLLSKPMLQDPFRVLLFHNVSDYILYGYGDPAVLKVPTDPATGREGALHYLVVTSNDAPNSYPILRSQDLNDWQLVSFVFPQGRKPPWASDGPQVSDFWAPEMHQVGKEFVVCFAAREKNSSLAIGVAKSDRPEGPFVSPEQPLLQGDVIDPHLFVDKSGTALLFWKEDSNGLWPDLLARALYERKDLIPRVFFSAEDRRTASLVAAMWPWTQTLGAMERFLVQQTMIEAAISNFSEFRTSLVQIRNELHSASLRNTIDSILHSLRTRVFAQELSADCLRLVGERRLVLENDQEWESHLIEGVWVFSYGAKYYMFYSGNDFSTAHYGIGVAIADSPLGPYTKMEEPLLRSTSEWLGPGHPSVVLDDDNVPRMFFHAFFPGRAGYKQFRALLSVSLKLDPDCVQVCS